eukprot:Transcript_25328.p1 GENE.Transcript_25328~~Transcript_25328.p1  ORF type:complete len:221 (-),score=11.76 Transcript_25328:213-875(-)
MPVAAAAPDTPRSVLRPGAFHRVEAKLAAARSSPEARNELASRIKDWERQRRATLYAHHNFLLENRAELPGRTWDTVHKRRSMLYATECRKVDAAQERRLKLLEEAELRRVEKGRRDAQRHAEAEARLPPRRPMSRGQRRPATAGPSSAARLPSPPRPQSAAAGNAVSPSMRGRLPSPPRPQSAAAGHAASPSTRGRRRQWQGLGSVGSPGLADSKVELA